MRMPRTKSELVAARDCYLRYVGDPPRLDAPSSGEGGANNTRTSAATDAGREPLPPLSNYDEACDPLRKLLELDFQRKCTSCFKTILRRSLTDDVYFWRAGEIQEPYERLAVRLEREIDALQRQKNRTLIYVTLGPVFAAVSSAIGLVIVYAALALISHVVYGNPDVWRNRPYSYVAVFATYAPIIFALLSWGMIIQANIRDNLQIASKIRDRRKAVTLALHVATRQPNAHEDVEVGRLERALEGELIRAWRAERTDSVRIPKAPHEVLATAFRDGARTAAKIVAPHRKA